MAATKGKKVFSAETKNKKKVEDLEPIVFDFYGEDLTALSWVPGLTTLNYLEGISNDEDNSAQLRAVNYYIKESFDKENYAKFQKVANDPKNGIELEEIMEVLSYITSERSSRPLKDSSQ